MHERKVMAGVTANMRIPGAGEHGESLDACRQCRAVGQALGDRAVL